MSLRDLEDQIRGAMLIRGMELLSVKLVARHQIHIRFRYDHASYDTIDIPIALGGMLAATEDDLTKRFFIAACAKIRDWTPPVIKETAVADDKTYVIRGRLIEQGMVDTIVTETELRRVATMAGITTPAAPVPSAPAASQSVSSERGSGTRDIQGTRLSMGGLRLPKQIVIRATDEFHVGHGGEIVRPEDLVHLGINLYGRAMPRESYQYPSVIGFKLLKKDFVSAPLLLGTVLGNGNMGTLYLLGNVMDALVEDADEKSDFAWVVLEPIIIPQPRTFPAAWS